MLVIAACFVPFAAHAATFSERIQASQDNATQKSDNNNFTENPTGLLGAPVLAGRSGASGSPFWYSGFYFGNITIPQGATISAATLEFTNYNNNTVAPMTADVSVEDTDNAVDFAANSSVAGRSGMSSPVNWTVPTVVIAGQNTDIDVTTIIQQLVSRSGWSTGNASVILVKTTSATVGDSYSGYYYADSPSLAAYLTVTYTTGGGGGGGGGGGTTTPPFLVATFNSFFQNGYASTTCDEIGTTSPVRYYCSATSTIPMGVNYGDWLLVSCVIIFLLSFVPITFVFSILKKK